jgi:hypothetical protein
MRGNVLAIAHMQVIILHTPGQNPVFLAEMIKIGSREPEN